MPSACKSSKDASKEEQAPCTELPSASRLLWARCTEVLSASSEVPDASTEEQDAFTEEPALASEQPAPFKAVLASCSGVKRAFDEEQARLTEVQAPFSEGNDARTELPAPCTASLTPGSEEKAFASEGQALGKREQDARVSLPTHRPFPLARRVRIDIITMAMPLPSATGLYDPAHERDACGLGFVADLRRPATHQVVEHGPRDPPAARPPRRGRLRPDARATAPASSSTSPTRTTSARSAARASSCRSRATTASPSASSRPTRRVCAVEMRVLEDAVRHHNQKVIGWRDVPVDAAQLGPLARASMPVFKQLFIGRMCPRRSFERTLFMIRKRAGRRASEARPHRLLPREPARRRPSSTRAWRCPSGSTRSTCDLRADETRSKLALVHSRFSTNTFPTWERAHPYRHIAHNGEINTLRGNQRWMAAREPLLESHAFGEHLADFKPIIRPGGSDSASLDNVVDFLVAGGRSLPHVMMMLVPEAWEAQPEMPAERSVRSTSTTRRSSSRGTGRRRCASPTVATSARRSIATACAPRSTWSRAAASSSPRASSASLDFDPDDVIEKGRLQPGRMLLVDFERGRIVARRRDQARGRVAQALRAVARGQQDRPRQPRCAPRARAHAVAVDASERAPAHARPRLHARGPAHPSRRRWPRPARSRSAAWATTRRSRSSASARRSLFRYFKQQFAQVTNPPIDPIREKLVMTLTSCVGGEGNLLVETPRQCRLLELPQPVLTNDELATLVSGVLGDFPVRVLPALFDAERVRSGSGARARAGRPCASRPRRPSTTARASSC